MGLWIGGAGLGVNSVAAATVGLAILLITGVCVSAGVIVDKYTLQKYQSSVEGCRTNWLGDGLGSCEAAQMGVPCTFGYL